MCILCILHNKYKVYQCKNELKTNLHKLAFHTRLSECVFMTFRQWTVSNKQFIAHKVDSHTPDNTSAVC